MDMKRALLLQIFLLGLWFPQARAATVYANSFDTSASLAGFTTLGVGSISVENQQLKATITSSFGNAIAMLNTSNNFSSPYKSTLAQNQNLVTWAFNISNENGAFNNGFHVILASTHANPYQYFATPAHGYYFTGGSMVGNRMGLWRFDYGIGGGQTALIDITDGLGPLPQTGSFKITYDPSNDRWSLFGSSGENYTDPLTVNSLLGTATDGLYTTQPTPYFGMGGSTSGNDYFDNLTVTIAPEPSALALVMVSMLGLLADRQMNKLR
jgi:hypothetical protein